jgi:transcription elongation factor GreA
VEATCANGGYHAAREEQGKMEARIVPPELLRTARVGEAPPSDDRARHGGHHQFDDDMDDTETFLLGSGDLLHHRPDRVLARSALGQAIVGAAGRNDVPRPAAPRSGDRRPFEPFAGW